MTGGRELRIDPVREGPVGDQLAGLGRRQRGGTQDRRIRERLELGEELQIPVLLGWSRGDQDEHRQPLQPAREIGEEPARHAVSPVSVVHGDQRRGAFGEPRREPVQAVHRRRWIDAR